MCRSYRRVEDVANVDLLRSGRDESPRQDFPSSFRRRIFNFFLFDHISRRHACRDVRCETNELISPSALWLTRLSLSFNSTYYGKDYRAGAALLRARRPYLFKNALTGFGLFAFSIGVCELVPTISAFRLFPVPSAQAPGHGANLSSVMPLDTFHPTGCPGYTVFT